jgi:hypothetical protein
MTQFITIRNRQWRICQETRNKIMTAARYIPTLEERALELRAIVKDLRRPKSVKEGALRELRGIERELGLDTDATKGYNG